jgi:hypothetical protein
MYAPNIKAMTREEARIAALQQQRIRYWRALERERGIAREAAVGATRVRAVAVIDHLQGRSCSRLSRSGCSTTQSRALASGPRSRT